MLDLSQYNGNIFSYADDTVAIFNGPTWHETYIEANQGLSIIKKWLDFNLLSLNISKTTFIPFSLTSFNLQNSDPNLNIKIHKSNCSFPLDCVCPNISKVNSVKYLGIVLV